MFHLPPHIVAAIRAHGTRVLVVVNPETNEAFVTNPAECVPLSTPMQCMDCEDAPAIGLFLMGYPCHLLLHWQEDGTVHAHPSAPAPTPAGGFLCRACVARRREHPSCGWYQIMAEV